MHTVELLEQAVAAAKQAGFAIRQEWLDGAGGGACQVGRKKWLFIDLAQNHLEQLSVVLDALRNDAATPALPLSPELRRLVGTATPPARKAA